MQSGEWQGGNARGQRIGLVARINYPKMFKVKVPEHNVHRLVEPGSVCELHFDCPILASRLHNVRTTFNGRESE